MSNPADLKQRIETVAKLCEEKAADVLLIAGDLFSEYAELEHISDAFSHLHTTFKPFFQRGGTILAITGNHDRDHKINTVQSGMKVAVPFAPADIPSDALRCPAFAAARGGA